jgi:hypothetical protein
MLFLGCCGSGIKTDNIIYFRLLHNQGMCSIVHEWVHVICAQCNPNISQIFGKFRISQINFSPLCGISRMSYQSSILLMLLFVPSQQLWLLFVCKSVLQMRNDRKVSKHLFRSDISSVAVLIITVIFSTIESIESTNKAFDKVLILIPMI